MGARSLIGRPVFGWRSRLDIDMEELELEFHEDDTSYSWLYNLLVTVLNPLIRRYVRSYAAR